MVDWRPAVALAAVLLVAGAGLATYLLAPRTSQAPDFTLTSTSWEAGNATTPQVFSLSDYRGQVVVLDFMAVMCTSCRVVTEEVLKPLQDEGLANVTILSIDTWADPSTGYPVGAETEATLVALQREEGVPWRHALDTDRVWEKYAAIALPKLVVVAPDGTLAYQASGIPALQDVRSAVVAARAGTLQATVPQAGLLGLAAAAGVASFFAPCAIGLLPAYLGVLLRDRAGRPVLGGLQVTLGMAASYAAIALAIAGAAALGWADALQSALPRLELGMGILLVTLAVLLLAGFDWGRLSRALRLPTPDGRRGLVAFGIGYALASFACTGPILLPILVASLSNGPLGVLAAFAIYAACLASFLVAFAWLVASGKRGVAQALVRHAAWANRIGALLILVGGLYLVWFYATALRVA